MGHAFADEFRAGLEAWLGGAEDGLARLEGMLDADVVWHLVGPEEPIRGRIAVIGALASDMDGLEVTGVVHDVLANDEHAVALISVDLRRGDRRAAYRATEIVHHRDGHVTERWAMVDDFDALARFWGD